MKRIKKLFTLFHFAFDFMINWAEKLLNKLWTRFQRMSESHDANTNYVLDIYVPILLLLFLITVLTVLSSEVLNGETFRWVCTVWIAMKYSTIDKKRKKDKNTDAEYDATAILSYSSNYYKRMTVWCEMRFGLYYRVVHYMMRITN